MDLIIDNRQDKVAISDEVLKGIENAMETCLTEEGKSSNYEISLSFVDDEEIRDLNREYRNKDSKTDVLSFPMDDDEDQDFYTPLLGDIVISLETALEQAKEYGHSLNREIIYLTVHSMFHLLGYDHMNEDDKAIMREKEKNVMKTLGIFKK